MNIGNMEKGMNDVDRFEPDAGYSQVTMVQEAHGGYVSYKDYAAIQQQLAAAREELATLRTLNEAHGGTAQLIDGTGETIHLLWGCCSNVHDTLASAVAAIACTCPSGDGSLRWPCPSHPPSSDANVSAVHRKLDERSAKGVREYGVQTDEAGLGSLEWLKHLQEELIDGAVYVEAAIATLQRDRQP